MGRKIPPPPSELEKQERYSLQAGVYAYAISQATKKPVQEVVLVFLRSGKGITVKDIDNVQVKAADMANELLAGKGINSY